MQGNRFFYEQGKLLLDGGGEGKFELRALGNNAYRLMEAPRRFVFTFFTRRDGLRAVRVDVEGSPVQRTSAGRGHKAERCRAACVGGKLLQYGVGCDVDVRSTRRQPSSSNVTAGSPRHCHPCSEISFRRKASCWHFDATRDWRR